MHKTNNPLIFIIEESNIYKELIVGHLKLNKYANIKVYKNGDQCMKDLHLNPDVIILDYSNEGISGLELMKKIQADKPNIDFIFLSGQNDVEVAVNIMKLGASDYVIKNDKAPSRLIKAIEQAIVQTKRQKLNKGFTIGVFGFFLLLLLVITVVISLVLFFNL